jgi:ADP-ribose pyrophosphatase YjhB (NUDIX family)
MNEYYTSQDKFYVSVDCIIFGYEEGELKVLLKKRSFAPFKGEWSLMGGFVRANESVDDAAKRVLTELTGIDDLYMEQLGAFGSVDRDPGERVISVAYYALVNKDEYTLNLDEIGGYWAGLNHLPMLGFGHKEMIQKARKDILLKLESEPVIFHLLPELFTLTQLQTLLEAISGNKIDKRNFRRRIYDMSYIEKTEHVDRVSSRRGATQYKFNKELFTEQAYQRLK